jgi:hypothetical protein
MSGDGSALASRIETQLTELESVIERTERQFSKAISSGDEDYLDGAALNLHSFYAGIERIFEVIAREIDNSMPTGPEWHRNLLVQMSAEISGTRPAVIGRSTRNCLDEYRGFRHLVRNIYTFNLRPSRVEELVTDLRPCYATVTVDIKAFCQFLNSLDE